MPYINPALRIALHEGAGIGNSGQLNYAFTTGITEYLNQHGHSYAVFNDIIGALEACKLEFVRRIVSPYEDKKRLENGDVY